MSYIELRYSNLFISYISYFFKRKGVISEETDKIATLLNTSERTVETLRDCDSYGAFLDKFIKNISKESVEAINNNENYWFLINNFLTSNSFEELANRTQQLVVNNVIDGAVKTIFTNKFLKNLKKYFDEFYFSEFPTEMTKTNFTKFLCKKIPSENFNSEEFVESNFLEEGKNCIYNLCEDFSAFSQNEQYALIIDFISSIIFAGSLLKSTSTLNSKSLLCGGLKEYTSEFNPIFSPDFVSFIWHNI